MTTRTIETVFYEKADAVHHGEIVMGLAQVKKTLLNGGIIGTNNNQLKMSKVNQIWRTLSKVNGTHVKCSQYVHDIIPRIGEVNILNQTLRFLIG